MQDPDHRFFNFIDQVHDEGKKKEEKSVFLLYVHNCTYHTHIDHHHHPTEPKQLINFFPVFLYLFFSSPLVSFSLVSLFFLFPKSGFSWMGCWLSFANAQLTPQLAALACHSLAVHPPRFRTQSKLPFQPRLRASATAMIQCCCWRFAGLVTSYKAIRNQSLGHPDHQSSPTSL